MTDLTELEQNADREARHGHRELVEKLQARVAELEAERDTEWDAAIRAAAGEAQELEGKWRKLSDYDAWYDGYPRAAVNIQTAILTLLRNEGGDDDQ